MILDAETLLAYFDREDPAHWQAAGEVDMYAPIEPLVISPILLPRLEGLVLERHGRAGWLAVLDELSSGAWTFAVVDADHLAAVRGRAEGGEDVANASCRVLDAS